MTPDSPPESAFAGLFAESANRPLLAKFALTVFVSAALLHGQAVTFDWVKWDDPPLVVNNPAIRSLSVNNLVAIFTPEAGKTYQPVRVLSYAIDHALFGLKPGPFHATNVLLHCLASALLVPLVFAMLSELHRGRERENRIIALIAALFFAAHPINVESVAWVASRKYGLLGLCSFLAFWCYLRSSQSEKVDWRFLGTAVVLALLAAMSSPFGVTIPVLIVFFDWCRGRVLSNLRLYVPFALCFAILYAMIAFALFAGEEGPGVGPTHIEGKFHWTLFTMLRVIFDYGVNLVCPLFLNHKYPNHFEHSILHWKILVVIVSLVAIAVFLVRDYRAGHRCPLFCVGWMLIAWAPVSNIVPISHTMADRYMYIPSVGFCLFLGLASNVLARRQLALALGIPLVALLLLAGLTLARGAVWKDDRTLWEASLRTDPANPTALFNIGVYEHNEGKLDAAEKKYRRSLSLFEINPSVHHNLGTLLVGKKRFPEAIAHLRRATELAPERTDSYRNLAGALAETGDLRGAAVAFGKWSELSGNPAGYLEAGLAFGHRGMHEQAIAEFERVLSVDAQHEQALKNLGVSHAITKNYPAAETYFRRVLAINPQASGVAGMLAQVRRAIAAQSPRVSPAADDSRGDPPSSSTNLPDQSGQ
jgi:Tfp pilus assembly protein PilF